MIQDFMITVNAGARSISRNVSGTYDENARFGATIQQDGNWNVSKSVNQATYEKNRESAMRDHERFENAVSELSARIAPIMEETIGKLQKELDREMSAGQGGDS